MKVKDLIKELRKQNPNQEVIIQRDPEGNGYSIFGRLYEAYYDKKENEMHISTKDFDRDGYDQDVSKLSLVVVLTPKY